MAKFSIGKPAQPSELVDRQSETKYLISRMESTKINYNEGFCIIPSTYISNISSEILSESMKMNCIYTPEHKSL